MRMQVKQLPPVFLIVLAIPGGGAALATDGNISRSGRSSAKKMGINQNELAAKLCTIPPNTATHSGIKNGCAAT